MSRILSEINKVCRLCLCQDEDILFPVYKLIDSTLTADEIERCTGVWVVEKNGLPYVLCLNCNNKLRNFVAYRSSCLSHDVRFRKWFALTVEDGSNDQTHSSNPVTVTHESTSDKCEMSESNEHMDTYNEAPFVEKIEVISIEEYEQIEEECIVDELYEETEEIMDEIEELAEEIYTEERPNSFDNFSYINDPAEDSQSLEAEPVSNESSSPAKHLFKECKQDAIATTMPRRKCANSSEEMNKKRNPPPKQLCPLCGKMIQSLADHMLSHTKESKFSCKYCPMTCSRKGYLKLHVAAVHMKRIVKTCEICGKGFSYIESYDAHMRSKHNFGEPFECKICNIKFRHKGGLRGHNNRKHNEDSNCACPICGMKFQDKKGLREHGRVHSNEKPYGCKYCEKWFKSTKSLKTHELIHQGVKFPCTMCDKIYTYKSLLNMHIRKCHELDSKICPSRS
uniref:Protein krueppel n=1 Tax=Anopheles christyi TaxID=43041 RepID=A0A182K750_9DIPT